MSRRLAIGVDLGGTRIRIGLANEKGQLIAKLVEETQKARGPEGISNQIIGMIRSLKKQNSDAESIIGIGIGSAGPLDMDKGGLMKPTNIPYDFVPLVDPLKDEFKLPTILLNDCSAAAMGEKYYGAGKGHENMVYITISTGIGGGIYVDGHLLVGKDGNAAEIGHFTIDHERRLKCGCGKKGHWEAYCSGRGIPNYVRLILESKSLKEVKNSLLSKMAGDDLGKLTAKTLYDAAKAGDNLALECAKKIADFNVAGFACVIDAYDPSLITVGGAIALDNLKLVIDPIRQNVNNYARNEVPEIHITPLGEDVVIYGALALVFHPGEYVKYPA
jgi:glucokinase